VEIERTHKRLCGIARKWRRRFGFEWHFLDDLSQQAWREWLEQDEACPSADRVGEEKRFDRVSSAIRRYCLRELYGYVPHQSRAQEEYLFRSPVALTVDCDFSSRVELRSIIERTLADPARKKGQDHARTLAMLAGLLPWPRNRHTAKERVRRLRKFLRG
jgi:hypothetical protein